MTRSLTSAAIVLLLVLSGCSSGTDDDTDSASGVNIEATGTEYSFSPAAWTVAADEEFSINFINSGTTEHEWAVIDLGEDLATGDDFAEEKVLLEVEAIDAGTETTQAFTITEPGTYQVVCVLPGHFDEGMVGSLVVE